MGNDGRQTGEWTKVQIKELNYLYYSPNVFHVKKIVENEIGRACSTYGNGRVYTGFWWGKDQLGDQGIDGRKYIKFYLQ